MSLNQIIEDVRKSNNLQQQICTDLLPIPDAHLLYFIDDDISISLADIREAVSVTEERGLSAKAIELKKQLVELLQEYAQEVNSCVKQAQHHNQIVWAKQQEEVQRMNSIIEMVPEKKLTQQVQINSTKFTPEHMEAFREIYLELGATHFLVEEFRDVIYYNPEVSPYMRDLIAERFLARFPAFVNPKGFMNITSVDFIQHLERIHMSAVK